MKSILIAHLVFFFLPNTIFAQFVIPSKKAIERFEKKKVLIPLSDTIVFTPTVVKYIKQYWPFENEIIVEPRAQVQKRLYKNSSKYFVFDYDFMGENVRKGNVIFYTPSLSFYLYETRKASKNIFLNRSVYSGGFGEYITPFFCRISIPISDAKETQQKTFWKLVMQQMREYVASGKIANKSWGNINLTKSTYDFFQIVDREVGLKNKTLLIPKEQCSLNENEIIRVYKYPFKIYTQKAIDSIVKTEDNSYAYFQGLWSYVHHTFRLYIVDLETNKLMGECTEIVTNNDEKLMKLKPFKAPASEFKLLISEKSLKKLNDKIAGKSNTD